MNSRRSIGWLGLATITALLIAACGSSSTPVPAQPTPTPTPTSTPTLEQMLAVISGDPGTEAEFGQILDKIQAGVGTCAPEPDRQRASDTLVASWQSGGKTTTLIKWAESIVTACGG